MPNQRIINVAVARPIYFLLSYHCEDEQAVAGCRVLVPLGNTEVTGVIISESEDDGSAELKSIVRLIDREPVFNADQIALFQWAEQYYHTAIGEIVFTALPVALRKTRQVPQQTIWQLAATHKDLDIDTLKRAKKQLALVEYLQTHESENPALTPDQAKEVSGSSYRNTLKVLQEKAWLEQKTYPAFTAIKPKTTPYFATVLDLTDEQQACLDSFDQWRQEKLLKPILLHGITGSGKTEVYLRMIQSAISQQQQALILVPEIGLTTQLIQRFQSYFPKQTVAVLNSAIANGERLDNWVAAKSGDAEIIIGTRSAVFTGFKSLGIIVIDEEHDGSFKQQDGFRYHARDIAVKRAYDLQIPIVLGTATPSLETLHNCHIGKYHYITMNSRPSTRKPPDIHVQDTKGLHREAGLSQPLLTSIRKTLNQQNQVMLFLNRRGFAPTLFCANCGWNAQCQNCDTNLTYHAKTQRMVCHHCQHEEKVKHSCPECNNPDLDTAGHGTERVEIALQGHFSDTPIIRIDRDTITKKGEMDRRLQPIRDGKPAILLGTQMLAKGHDFPNVTLVGILDIDQSLFSTDYRAAERLAQLIIQVAGRSGRGEQKGTVLLQTCQPDHPLLVELLGNGYLAFANALLEQRKQWNFPPYSYQALIRAESLEKKKALNFLEKVSEQFNDTSNVTLMGPMPSPMERRAKWYRAQLLLMSNHRKALHQAIGDQLISISKIRKGGKVRWAVDVDPTELS